MIPPDTNIEQGQSALDYHRTQAGGDSDDNRSNLVDLLTDLRHWAHAQHIDFEAALQLAAIHFEAEQEFAS